jgi:hypothetical protein
MNHASAHMAVDVAVTMDKEVPKLNCRLVAIKVYRVLDLALHGIKQFT